MRSMFVALFSMAVFATTAQANLLGDGDFELATTGGAGTGSSPAWTVTAPSAAGYEFSNGAWAVQAGAQGFWFQSFAGALAAEVDVEIAETVAAGSAGDASLSFWAAREPNVAADSIIASLSVNGTVVDSIDLLTATFNDGLNFADGTGTQFSLSAPGVLATDSLSVSVAMLGGLDAGINPQSLMVDSFDLNVVPEPASLALAGFGLLSVLASRRRR